MQVKTSLLKKSSYILVLIILAVASCKTLTIWNIPEKEFSESIKKRNFDFLKDINTKHMDISELESLGPGNVFYMAFVFEDMGSHKLREKALAYELENGNDPWREESLYLLAKSYLDQGNYRKAERLIHKNRRKTLKDERIDRIYIEALYWQHKDKNVLRQIKKINLDSKGLKASEISELELFRAVSSARIGKKHWNKLFFDIFMNQPNSRIHKRAWDFISQKEAYVNSFTGHELELIKAQKYLALGDYSRASQYFESYIKTASAENISPELINNSLKAFIYASGKAEHAALFSECFKIISDKCNAKKETTESALFSCVFSAGKLYRKMSDYKNAEYYFSQSMKYCKKDLKLPLWYYLDSAFKISIENGLSVIDEYRGKVDTPGYFSDIFDSLAVDFILESQYSKVLALYKKMYRSEYRDFFTKDIEARYAYILFTAKNHSLVDRAQINEIMPDIVKSIENSGNLFYLSKIYTDRKVSFPRNINYNMILPRKEKEEVLNGFLEYGFYRKVYSEIRSDIYSYDPDFLKKAACIFNENNLYLESISIMGIVSSMAGFDNLYKSDLKILYPLAHEVPIKNSAEKAGVDPELFFALVRSESAFKADIKSRAGAVGLSQLMPATAAEEAGRLRLGNPDLNDPEVNAMIGANYFSRLLKRFGSPEKALAAYNAGPGRVRRWEKQYSYVPEELFAEIIPFAETRKYVMDVLEASQYYKYLYENN